MAADMSEYAVHYQTTDGVWHLALVEADSNGEAEDTLLGSVQRGAVQRIWSEIHDGRYAR